MVCSFSSAPNHDPPGFGMCVAMSSGFNTLFRPLCQTRTAGNTSRTMDFLNKMSDQAKDTVEVRASCVWVRVLYFLPHPREAARDSGIRKSLQFVLFLAPPLLDGISGTTYVVLSPTAPTELWPVPQVWPRWKISTARAFAPCQKK